MIAASARVGAGQVLLLSTQSVFLRIPLSPFRHESGGEGVKNDQKIKVLRMGWPIVENVPTSCGIILNLFRSPPLNPRKKSKNQCIFIQFPDFPYFPVFSLFAISPP